MQSIPDLELHDLYSRLGKVVLVPLENNGEILANPPSFSHTQNEAYFRQLVESNVGLRLGPTSGNLYGLLFYNDAAEAAFFKDNPTLAETAIADVRGLTMCFFRLDGFAPRSKKWSDGEWAGAGSYVPLRTKGQSYPDLFWIDSNPPARIEFDSLVWTGEALCLFTPDIIEARYGPPFFLDRNGVQQLNSVFWAYYFARENGIVFSEERQQFFWFNTDGSTWQELPRLTLENSLLQFLAKQIRKPEFKAVAPRMNSNARKQIITELQVAALSEFPEPVDNMKQFVTDCLGAHDGTDVSIKELYTAYVQFCNTRQISRLREREFQKKITGLIEASHGATRSHSIQRPDGNPRGFRNLRLKLSVYETPREKYDAGDQRLSQQM
jgi:hypothetical protein